MSIRCRSSHRAFFVLIVVFISFTFAFEAHAQTFKVGSFTKATGGAPASQTVAHGLGETPKALILWTNGKTNESFSASFLFGFGVTDQTRASYSGAASSQDVINSNTGRGLASKALTIVNFSGIGAIAEADLTSWDATNFTLNWTTNDANAYVIHFIAIGGSDVSSKVVTWTMPAATGNRAVTGVGFRPNLVIHGHLGQDFTVGPGFTSQQGHFGLGVMDAAGNQWATDMLSRDNLATTDTQRGQQTDGCIYAFNNGLVVQKKASFYSMDSDGFTVNFTNTTSAALSNVFSLALKGINVKVGNFTKSAGTAPVSQEVTGIGFKPNVVFLASFQDTVQANPVANTSLGLGASDGTTQGSSALTDTNARAAIPVVQGIDKTSKVFMKVNNNTSTIDAEANLTSMDTDRFTLNWTNNDAVATQMLHLALGSQCTFSYRKTVTVQAGQVSGGPHTNFPMLVSFTDANLRTSTNGGRVANPNGYDIIFRAFDDTTCGGAGNSPCTLDHEIERYNASTGELVAWVRVPSINNGTAITMLYGNSCINSSTENPSGVWINNYRGVWHLKETVTDEGTSGTHSDSTSNGNNGSQNGNDDIAGQFYNGQDFDGNVAAPDYVNVPYHSSLDFGAGQDFTVSVWVKTTQPVVNDVYPLIVSKEYDGSIPRQGFSLVLHAAQWNSRWYLDTYFSGTQFQVYGLNDIADGNWHYIVGVRSGSNIIAYENGSYADTTAASSASLSRNVPLRMGTSCESTPGSWSIYDGIIDEVRISGVARSPGWIQTEYNNQNSPSAFYAIGSEEELGYRYRKQISIDYTKLGADCSTPTNTWQVSANNLDAWDDGASGSLNQSIFGDSTWSDSGGYQWAVTIPQGATITSARIKVYSAGHVGAAGSYTARIRIEDVDNASPFTGAVNNIRGRTYWGTTVDWTIPAGGLPTRWNSSPDITTLIQHIVNRAGWVSGNYLSIAIWGQTSSGTGCYEDINDFSTNPSLAAQLEVTYQTNRPLTDFPVLINIANDNDLRTAPTGHVQNSNGYDIDFRTSDGITKLDHEIERYDGASGSLVAWVRVPTLYNNQNTNIYMYYGNPGITSPTANPAGVWRNSFREVWHLHETGGGTVTDSAPNRYTGTASAGVNQNPVTEKIDGADEFNGSTGVLSLSDGTLTGNSPFTMEAWFRLRNLPADPGYAGIVTKNRDQASPNDWAGLYVVYDTTWGPLYPAFTFGWGWNIGQGGNLFGSTTLSTGQWYYAVGTYDGTNRRLYLNATQDASDSGAFYNDSLGMSARVAHDGVDARWLDGFIDEVRISNTARGLCWIQTSYNNQNSPSTFYSVGSETGPAPTAVKLTSFSTTQYSDGVLLRWKTGYEANNLGFHVYREENGQLVRLTPEPVAGSALLAGSRTALTAGHHYHWWDAYLSPQSSSLSTVRYWLKDIDLNGTHTMHGPVTTVFSRELTPDRLRPELLSERGMRLQERYRDFWRVRDLKEKLALKRSEVRGAPRGRGLRIGNRVPLRIGPAGLEVRGFYRQPDSSADKVQRYLASQVAIKVMVREEGWYRITQPELVAAGLNPKVNPRFLQLYADGKEQPIRITGKGTKFDAIEFYGVGLDTPSTDTRVYWLVEGLRPGKRVELSHNQAGRIASSSYPYTIEKRDRTIYFAALRNGEAENFFGPVVYMNEVDQILEVRHLDRATSEGALLEVVLQGATETPHRVRVLLNEAEVGEIAFEGQGQGTLKVEVSQSMLEEGENLVSFVAMGDEMDATLLDTVRLTYWHTYTADKDSLRLTVQGGSHLTVNGFSHPKIRVIDITDSGGVTKVFGKVEPQKGGYAISFRVPEHGERTLLALTEERVKSPIEIVSNHLSAWHQEKDGYDLVIVTHRDFFESLQPLQKLRESQGLKVALVDVEDLYDEFSFGNKSPKALKDFLSLTKKQWNKPPRFVLLVGDASFDPKNYLGLGDMDYVPSKLIDTTYMETASDDWFADLNDDGLPEMAIGRLPVQTTEEAAIVVSKIVGYEKSGKKNEALLVADINDGFNFEGASEELRALLPAHLTVRKIFRGDFGSDAQAKAELLQGINQGALLVNFIGHGSIESWRGIFSSEDAESLINGFRLPFFVNMTCLNGFFQNPYGETLAEALMKASGGGAIAIWTSSGLTEPDKQAVMNKELIKLLFGRESITLGEATAKAKAATGDQDIRKTWILFGDPATRLRP